MVRPGSVNIRRKNCVFLPAAVGGTQSFHLLFTEPRAHHKVHTCILNSKKIYFRSDLHLQDLAVEQLSEFRVLLHGNGLEVRQRLEDVQGLKIVLQSVI